jgi:RimJ/RimL family protein N-acetyltransferase
VKELTTERLRIRAFTHDDRAAARRIVKELGWSDDAPTEVEARADAWLTWNALTDHQQELLVQPPIGDRAIVLRDTEEVIGACGFTMALGRFGRIPGFRAEDPGRFSSPELGLFYAVLPAYRRTGIALEAARALVAHAFERLRVARVVGTTEHDNEGSIAVMRKLGMRIERPTDAGWLQVVGILENGAA